MKYMMFARLFMEFLLKVSANGLIIKKGSKEYVLFQAAPGYKNADLHAYPDTLAHNVQLSAPSWPKHSSAEAVM